MYQVVGCNDVISTALKMTGLCNKGKIAGSNCSATYIELSSKNCFPHLNENKNENETMKHI